nr:uncharacterized protein LOC123859402 isoform X2 [Mirounga angustirostris]
MKWIYRAHKIYSLQCPSERQGKNFWLFIPTSVYSRSSEAICPAKHTYHAHRLPNRQPAKSLPKPLGKEAARKEGVRPAAVRGRGTGDGEGRCRRARARGVRAAAAAASPACGTCPCLRPSWSSLRQQPNGNIVALLRVTV